MAYLLQKFLHILRKINTLFKDRKISNMKITLDRVVALITIFVFAATGVSNYAHLQGRLASLEKGHSGHVTAYTKNKDLIRGEVKELLSEIQEVKEKQAATNVKIDILLKTMQSDKVVITNQVKSLFAEMKRELRDK